MAVTETRQPCARGTLQMSPTPPQGHTGLPGMGQSCQPHAITHSLLDTGESRPPDPWMPWEPCSLLTGQAGAALFLQELPMSF